MTRFLSPHRSWQKVAISPPVGEKFDGVHHFSTHGRQALSVISTASENKDREIE